MSVRPEELADVLVRRARERHATEDARARELRSRLLGWARDASTARLFARAWLIGSLKNGGFGQGSDVDVVLEGLPLARAGEVWGSLGSLLGTEVDLLRLEELPESFQQYVLAHGERLGEP